MSPEYLVRKIYSEYDIDCHWTDETLIIEEVQFRITWQVILLLNHF